MSKIIELNTEIHNPLDHIPNKCTSIITCDTTTQYKICELILSEEPANRGVRMSISYTYMNKWYYASVEHSLKKTYPMETVDGVIDRTFMVARMAVVDLIYATLKKAGFTFKDVDYLKNHPSKGLLEKVVELVCETCYYYNYKHYIYGYYYNNYKNEL